MGEKVVLEAAWISGRMEGRSGSLNSFVRLVNYEGGLGSPRPLSPRVPHPLSPWNGSQDTGFNGCLYERTLYLSGLQSPCDS